MACGSPRWMVRHQPSGSSLRVARTDLQSGHLTERNWLSSQPAAITHSSEFTQTIQPHFSILRPQPRATRARVGRLMEPESCLCVDPVMAELLNQFLSSVLKHGPSGPPTPAAEKGSNSGRVP